MRYIRYQEQSNGIWQDAKVKDTGDITQLNTRVKTDLTSAINSIVGDVSSISGGLGSAEEDIRNILSDLLNKADVEWVDGQLQSKVTWEEFQPMYEGIREDLKDKVSQGDFDAQYDSIIEALDEKVSSINFKEEMGRIEQEIADGLAQQDANREALKTELNKRIDNIDDAFDGVQESIGQIESKIDDELEKVNTTIAGVQSDINDAKGDISQAKKDITSITGDLDNITEGLGDVTEILESVQTDVSDAKESIGSIEGSVSDIKTDLSGIHVTIGENNSALGELEGRVTEVEVTAEGLEANMSSVTTDLGAVKTDVSSLKVTAEGLETKMTSVTEGLEETNTKVGEIEATASGLEASFTEINKTVGETVSKVGELEVTAEGLEASFSEVQETVDGHSTKIGSLTTDVDGMKGQFASIDETLDSHTTKIGSLETTASGLEAQFVEVNDTISGHTEKIGSLEVTVGGFEASFAEIDETLDEQTGAIESHTEKIGSLETTVDGFKASFTEINSTLEGHTEKIGSLTTDVNGMKGEFSSISETLEGHTTQIGSIQTTVGGFETRFTEINDTISGHTTKIGSLETTVSGFEASFTEINETIDGYEERVGGLETTASGLTAQFGEISNTVNGHAEKIGTLTVDVSGMKGEFSEIQETVSGHTTKIGTIEAGIDGFEATVGQIQETVGGHTTQLSSLTTDVGSIKGTVSSIEESYGGISSQVAELVVDVSGITTSVSNISTEQTKQGERLTSAESDIKQNAEDITQRVTTSEFDELGNVVESHTSTITQLSDAIIFHVGSLETEGENVKSMNSRMDFLEKEITFKITEDNLNEELGKLDSKFATIQMLSDEISLTVSQTEFDESFGLNKWIVSRYNTNLGATNSIPAFAHIQGLAPSEQVELADAMRMQPFSGEGYIAHYFTNIWMQSARTVSLTLNASNTAVIFMNGARIVETTGEGTTASLSLRQGWNSVELLHYNHSGDGYVDLGTIFSNQVEKLTAHIGIGNKDSTRLAQAESSIVQNTNSITLTVEKVEKIDESVSANTAFIEVYEDRIKNAVTSEELNPFNQRLTATESFIEVNKDRIEQAVIKTEFDPLNDRVTEQGSSITQLTDAMIFHVGSLETEGENVKSVGSRIEMLEEGITLAVKEQDFDALTETALESSATIQMMKESITSKVEKNDFNALTESALQESSTIEQLAGKIESKVEKNDFNSLTETHLQSSATITQLNNLISSKVSETSFEGLEGRVKNAESTIDQFPNMISSKVEQSTFDTYKNEVTNNFTEIRQGVSDITLTVGEVRGDLDNNVLKNGMATGKMLFTDPTFANGLNGTSKYANSGAEVVAFDRIASPSGAPTSSGYVLRITTTGTVSPAHGGFKWAHQSRANAIFIYRIIANIPVGRNITWASNAIGTNGNTTKWLTPVAGTGKWEEYIHYVKCGSEETFSTTGFFYASGGATPTEEESLTWHVAYATCFDATESISGTDMVAMINMTPSNIKISAESIDISGAVTFSSFDSETQSKITNIESTASSAKTTADTANSTANTAKTTADTANSTASTAKTTAESAQSTAQTASTNASNAVNTANTAKTTADGVNTTVNNNKGTWDRASNINSDGTFNTAKLSGTIADSQVASASKWNTASENAVNALNRMNDWTYSGQTTINGGKIQTDTITAVQIDVKELSALTANLGTVNAGVVKGASMELNLGTGTYYTEGTRTISGYQRYSTTKIDNGYINMSYADSTSGVVQDSGEAEYGGKGLTFLAPDNRSSVSYSLTGISAWDSVEDRELSAVGMDRDMLHFHAGNNGQIYMNSDVYFRNPNCARIDQYGNFQGVGTAGWWRVQASDGTQVLNVGLNATNAITMNRDLTVNGNIKATNYSDSGWVTLTLANGFTNYNGTAGNQPRVRKIGNVVHVVGVVSPPASNTLGSDTAHVIATLPSGYRPTYGIRDIMQGTGRNKWLFVVGTGGQLEASRYNVGGTNSNPGNTTWMPFYATFIVN